MKKVGIVTWYKNGNFGGTLQAFALSKIYERLNLEVEFINYNPHKDFSSIFLRYIKDFIVFLIYKPIYLTRQRIKHFIELNLRESQLFTKYNVLSEYANKNYLFVSCGSDQIWAIKPNVSQINEFYYLTFVDEKKRLAYAPSIGLNYIPEQHKEQFKELVSKIPYLSVREETGAKLIYDLANIKAHVNLDPTLMLSKLEWNNLLESTRLVNYEYVLCYFLSDNPQYEMFRDKLCTLESIKCINVQINKKGYLDKNTFAVNPFDFIRLIRDAKYVLTDSYHGMIFSVLFEKQVGIFSRFKDCDKISQNSRINDLLEKLDLEYLLISDIENYNIYDFTTRDINYEKANQRLELNKKRSFDFLNFSINSIKQHQANE